MICPDIEAGFQTGILGLNIHLLEIVAPGPIRVYDVQIPQFEFMYTWQAARVAPVSAQGSQTR